MITFSSKWCDKEIAKLQKLRNSLAPGALNKEAQGELAADLGELEKTVKKVAKDAGRRKARTKEGRESVDGIVKGTRVKKTSKGVEVNIPVPSHKGTRAVSIDVPKVKALLFWDIVSWVAKKKSKTSRDFNRSGGRKRIGPNKQRGYRIERTDKYAKTDIEIARRICATMDQKPEDWLNGKQSLLEYLKEHNPEGYSEAFGFPSGNAEPDEAKEIVQEMATAVQHEMVDKAIESALASVDQALAEFLSS